MLDPMSSFEVKNIIPLHFLGLDLSITNSSLYMMLVVGIVLAFFSIGTKNVSLVPSKAQCIIEKMFFFMGDIVKTNAGDNGIRLFPYMFALFLFICLGNMIGLLPFAFSFTSQLVVTFGMAFIVFVSSIIIGIRCNGIHYFRHFCPSGLPSYIIPFFVIVELMSFAFRPVSLGIRLFANIVAGHVMIKIIAGFAVSFVSVAALSGFAILPIALDILLNIFKLGVCVLQAYVFVVLSCMYLAESMAAHDEH
ncbi:MAG: F0F1 ATP synthase subunit A [Holosporales bacterium]|jgi:F-type H+-transporting ATPase subunit a|nr:F0F1 ATP synthase subunit A [Holosporales bacterium]